MVRRERTDIWRFFDPRYVRALEQQRSSDKRAIDSFVLSIGRQAPAGSETQLRGDLVLLHGRVNGLEVAAELALQYMRSGRHEAAASVLSAILDSSPLDQQEAS